MRVLYLWLPHLATDLWARRHGEPVHALVEQRHNTWRLAALSVEACAQGLEVGQTLSEARVLMPALTTQPFDPAALAQGLHALARFSQGFSPLVGLDGDDALAIDVRGLARLYGGEATLLNTLHQSVEDLGFQAELALADTKGAAWALARFGSFLPEGQIGGDTARGRILAPGTAAATLAPFPLAALRIAPKAIQALHRLGIKTLADLGRLPRAQLTRRYGPEILRRLEQTLGRHGEPLAPLPPPSPLSARLRFPQPLDLKDDLMLAAERLVQHLSAQLVARQIGLTRLHLVAETTSGQIQTRDLGFAAPTRDPTLILRLLDAKVETLSSDFGFESLRLAARATAPLADQQTALVDTHKDPAQAQLLATLGNRLGFDRLQRHVPQSTHLPDREVAALPVLDARQSPKGPRTDPPTLAPRPILRLPSPEPIEVLSHGSQGIPPTQFRWRRQTRTTLTASGPERVSPPWWYNDPNWTSTRDYWCVQTQEGPRLWLFHALRPQRWFVAGELA